nr:hypothetical protein [Myxococcales bacterium]
MSDDLSIATAALDGAGNTKRQPPRTDPTGSHPAYRRRIANYLLDKRLQLRYVVVVTLLSAIICGVLGTLIYRQEQQASSVLEEDLKALTDGDASLREFQAEVARDMESRDRALVAKMIAAGFGLVLILSVYLVVMTHKVAGPLYKISSYFDRMAAGRFSEVSALRRGDMLQDFFSGFQDMNAAMRARMLADLDLLDRACQSARAANVSGELADEIGRLEQHLTERRAKLA